ncbi:MAG TPA: LytTR family DNA-binding domain-containing protein, partial [Puia sp.]|nr:LytTR family DNA-binding domain-containing protein [Puia sp.]
ILQGYIRRDPRLVLEGACRTAPETLEKLNNGTIDLLFLDIQLPDISGIRLLQNLTPAPLVIFTTAFREYALDAFELNAVDYLLKPFSFDRFLQAVNKAAELLQTRQEVRADREKAPFFIRDGTKLILLPLEDILYAEALREYVRIVTATKQHVVHISMKGLEQKLPAGQFVRIHKSYIISVSRITAIEGGTVTIGGRRLPISRQDRNEVLEKITKNRFIG